MAQRNAGLRGLGNWVREGFLGWGILGGGQTRCGMSPRKGRTGLGAAGTALGAALAERPVPVGAAPSAGPQRPCAGSFVHRCVRTWPLEEGPQTHGKHLEEQKNRG